MSLDAEYIFEYDIHTPEVNILKDKIYLNQYGGYFENITKTTLYWDKPKHTLPKYELDKLHCDQILEKKQMELWEIIK